MPKNIQALLLDLDGTLANSIAIMQNVYSFFLEEFGIKASKVEFSVLNGPSLFEVVHRLKQSYDLPGSLDTLYLRYCTILDQAYSKVFPNPGARELLESAKLENCKVGIVTSNSKPRTQNWLSSVKLFDLVDFIISSEDVKHCKPDPEPYHLAINHTKCSAENIIAVEDSPQGALSAINAGLFTYVLGDNLKLSDWPQNIKQISSLIDLVEIL